MILINILIISAVVVFADKKSPDIECDQVLVHGKYHTKDVLADGLDLPYQLSIYKPEHKIFFSYNIGKKEEDTFKLGYIEKGKKNFTEISNVKNGFASAVDETNHHVFLGGSKGIYKYNQKKKEGAVHKIISGHDIWYMFFKSHHLYFIDFPFQKLYKYNTSDKEAIPEHQTHITEKIYQFIIDKDDDQFITTDKGLFAIKNDTVERIHYSKEKNFRGAALNNDGEAYFCGNHSIYVVNKQNHSLEEIAYIRNVFGITFDGENNIIYADPNEIVKLVPGTCKSLNY